jgi:hypothetical protein
MRRFLLTLVLAVLPPLYKEQLKEQNLAAIVETQKAKKKLVVVNDFLRFKMSHIHTKRLLFCFVLIASAILFTCFCKQQTKNKAAKFDSFSLFDGMFLKEWEITDFDNRGKVYVKDNSIIIEKGETCSGIRWMKKIPKINYEIMIEAKRVAGNDFFCGMTFPVQNEYCTLIIGGWGGTVVGLSCIDGLDASENETGVMKKFNNGQWYFIRLRVTAKSIQAWINEEKYVDFEKSDQKLSLRWEVEPSKPFGIATWKTTAAIKNIRVRKF